MNHMRQSLIGRCLNFFAMLAFLVLQVPGAAFADSTAGETEARKAIKAAAVTEPAKAEPDSKANMPVAATDATEGEGFASSLGKGFRSFMDKLSSPSNPSSQAGTKVTHEAIKFFVPEKRIRLDAAVTDSKGVTMVRAYFKGKTQADYVFVPMEAQQTAKDSYVAILPAMVKSNDEIQYLFLVVNGANVVLKTEPFVVQAKVSADVPSWQMVNGDESVKLFTEVPDAPAVAASFSDSVSLNVVESGARFGLVAQLYGASGSATASGAAAGATNAGTTSVATAGMSTVTIAAAAAGLVGVAAAGGGGGGSSSAAPAAPVTPVSPVTPVAPVTPATPSATTASTGLAMVPIGNTLPATSLTTSFSYQNCSISSTTSYVGNTYAVTAKPATNGEFCSEANAVWGASASTSGVTYSCDGYNPSSGQGSWTITVPAPQCSGRYTYQWN